MRSLMAIGLGVLVAACGTDSKLYGTGGVGAGATSAGGAAAGGNGGAACDCTSPSDCGTDTDCQSFSCEACVCSASNVAINTACDDGRGCDASNPCVCDGNGSCLTLPCNDGELNGDETDVDCGGSCPACENCNMCSSNADCESGYCDPSSCGAGGAGGTGGSGGAPSSVCAACNNNAQCDDDKWCSSASATCLPDLAQGSPCTDDAECVGNANCVDAVCCDAACGGSCDVCSQAKGASADGTCTILPYGTLGEPLCSSMICDGTNATCQATCVSQALERVHRPVDIIFAIDNSGSMGGEILEIEKQLNLNFYNIIESTTPAIDYRVIMVSSHGVNAQESICIAAPLGGVPDNNMDGHCDSVPSQPVNTAKFYHHSIEVGSHDALCDLLNMYDTADDHALQPNGYGAVLRDDASKFFVVITDDGVNCTHGSDTYNDLNTVSGGQAAGNQWDTDLLALSPTHFGTAAARNYSFWSITALEPYMPTAMNSYGSPHPPNASVAPITTTECTPGAQGPGTGYQQLSILTGGYRYPSCGTDYNALFTLMAHSVIGATEIPCTYSIPDPPAGKTVDETTMLVEHSDQGTTVSFPMVANAAACTNDEFYIDNGQIKLCPSACTKADTSGTLEAHYQCP